MSGLQQPSRLGKRQVRPNLSRNSDFGYTERPRVPIQKVPKKPKRTEEDEEAGGASARLEKDASRSLVRGAPRYCAALRTRPALPEGRSLWRLRLRLCRWSATQLARARAQTVDFTKLDMATLKRYKRHFRLKTRQNVTKTELALAVAKHFASQNVDEVRAGGPSVEGSPARVARPTRLPRVRRPRPSSCSCTRRDRARCSTVRSRQPTTPSAHTHPAVPDRRPPSQSAETTW